MTALSDRTLAHLQAVVECPEEISGSRYAIVERIGAGGMGTVFRARDEHLEREVALKVSALDRGEDISALLAEARVLASLDHPGIVPIHDAGRLEDGRPFYVMALVQGNTLAEYAAANPDLTDRLRLFDRLCDVLSFAHARGIVHRDVTPANVMIGRFGEVRVLDWGLAARTGQTGAAGGTSGYMAPEQLNGAVDPRADVFSLGSLLRDLAHDAHRTSRYPGRPLRSIIDRALATNPDARYPSVSALAADVRRYVDGERVVAHEETFLERAGRLGRTYRTALLLVGAYLTMRVLLLWWR
jgi:serine/threonine-protein kinase